MFRTLDEADVKGKRVLVRVDLNVPVENGEVADATRIERAAPTIREIAEKGGKAILLSHFGRPTGFDPAQSLAPIVPAIAGVMRTNGARTTAGIFPSVTIGSENTIRISFASARLATSPAGLDDTTVRPRAAPGA